MFVRKIRSEKFQLFRNLKENQIVYLTNFRKFIQMKPLITDQRILTWLCVLPAKENTSKWEKRAYIALVLAVIMGPPSVFLFSSMYIVKFMSIDLIEVLCGFYQAIAAITAANAIVVTFFFRHKIPPVFEKLSEFYEKCKNSSIFFLIILYNVVANAHWGAHVQKNDSL